MSYYNNNQNQNSDSNICPFCGVNLATNYDFNNHISLCPFNPDSNYNLKNNKNNNQNLNFNQNYPLYAYQNNNFSNLNNGITNSCPFCHLIFNSQLDLGNHMKLCPLNPARSVIPIQKKSEADNSSFLTFIGVFFITLCFTLYILFTFF